MVWQNGQFSWFFVGIAIYLVVLLLFSDALWRLTRIGGKVVFLISLLGMLAGLVALWMVST
jgi:hypothetical protein